MVAEDKTHLLYKLKVALSQLNHVKNEDEAIVIMNYIANISMIFNSSEERLLNIDNYRLFINYISKLENQMLENFIKNKDYYTNYLSQVIPLIEKEMVEFKEGEMSPPTKLDEADFYAIFYEFMESLNLASVFDEFIENHNIYSTETKSDSTMLGFTLHNPLTNDSDIFIGDFNFDIHTMFTLAHEFGHIYDLNYDRLDAKSFNRYFYHSFSTEVMSKMFERLFLDFLIKKDILKEEAKDKLFEMEVINHDFLLASYILTLLDDELLLDSNYQDLSIVELYNKVADNFNAKDNLFTFFLSICKFDVLEDYTYTYGDLLSIVLKDEVLKNGLNNDLLLDFMKKKTLCTGKDIIIDWQMTPEKYQELYKREVQFIKK